MYDRGRLAGAPERNVANRYDTLGELFSSGETKGVQRVPNMDGQTLKKRKRPQEGRENP